MHNHIMYTGESERKPIKTDHRLLLFQRFSYKNDADLNNKPYDDILARVPDAYCDGWNIFLPNNFDRKIIQILIKYFQDRYFHNIKSIEYVNDERKKITKIFSCN